MDDISSIKIGIAGAGGLGSNCAFNLLRSGFLNFKIFDFDCIEKSNLNRQFYFYDQLGIPKVFALKENLKRINYLANIEVEQILIDKENIYRLFDDCNVIVEAFDKVEYKKLIIDCFADSNKLLVCASGVSGYGNFEKIQIKKFNSNFYIVGDFETEANENTPPISPKINIIAALQADVILSYFKNKQCKE